MVVSFDGSGCGIWWSVLMALVVAYGGHLIEAKNV